MNWIYHTSRDWVHFNNFIYNSRERSSFGRPAKPRPFIIHEIEWKGIGKKFPWTRLKPKASCLLCAIARRAIASRIIGALRDYSMWSALNGIAAHLNDLSPEIWLEFAFEVKVYTDVWKQTSLGGEKNSKTSSMFKFIYSCVLTKNSSYIMRHKEDRRQDLGESEKDQKITFSSPEIRLLFTCTDAFLNFASFLSKLALKSFQCEDYAESCTNHVYKKRNSRGMR